MCLVSRFDTNKRMIVLLFVNRVRSSRKDYLLRPLSRFRIAETHIDLQCTLINTQRPFEDTLQPIDCLRDLITLSDHTKSP
jgi:hypothetical protein